MKLPKGQELIVLAREYVDDKWNMDERDYGFNIQTLAQQDFLKIVNWLKEKGY